MNCHTEDKISNNRFFCTLFMTQLDLRKFEFFFTQNLNCRTQKNVQMNQMSYWDSKRLLQLEICRRGVIMSPTLRLNICLKSYFYNCIFSWKVNTESPSTSQGSSVLPSSGSVYVPSQASAADSDIIGLWINALAHMIHILIQNK